VPKPRRPFKFWAMATVTGVFTLLGLVFVAVGPDADTRVTGLMCILFFGLGGLGYLGGPLLTRSGPGTVLRERVQTSAGSEAAFVFPTPRRKRIVVTIGMFGFTAGGVLITLAGGGWIGILCAGFFGLLFLLGLFSLRRPQRLVPTTPSGPAVAGSGGSAATSRGTPSPSGPTRSRARRRTSSRRSSATSATRAPAVRSAARRSTPACCMSSGRRQRTHRLRALAGRT
jgi:hypothetical protein